MDDIVIETPLAPSLGSKIFRRNCLACGCSTAKLTAHPAAYTGCPRPLRRNQLTLPANSLRYDFCAAAVVKNCSRREFVLGMEVYFRARTEPARLTPILCVRTPGPHGLARKVVADLRSAESVVGRPHIKEFVRTFRTLYSP